MSRAASGPLLENLGRKLAQKNLRRFRPGERARQKARPRGRGPGESSANSTSGGRVRHEKLDKKLVTKLFWKKTQKARQKGRQKARQKLVPKGSRWQIRNLREKCCTDQWSKPRLASITPISGWSSSSRNAAVADTRIIKPRLQLEKHRLGLGVGTGGPALQSRRLC